MVYGVKKLFGYKIRATDGSIGKVQDLYFDDAAWKARYLVADTGGWLQGREVLISSVSTGTPIPSERTVMVDLTMSQVETSPPVDAAKPVSRQYEERLNAHYGWPVYWLTIPAVPGGVAPMNQAAAMRAANKSEETLLREGVETDGDPNLRSVREVTGYHIQASDGDIGHVEDFIVDTDTWMIRYMVVDTRNWLPGKKVLVAKEWIDSVDWGERSVHVRLSRNEIKDSPDFDPDEPVDREYEARLYDYYGRPKYW